jgi:hypothetical protein
MTTPSIDDLMSGMQQLTKSGAKDTTLTVPGRNEYAKVIKDYRNTLTEVRTKAAKLVDYGNVGDFWSAVQTRTQLVEDVTGTGGFLASLDGYIAYLEQFENTVTAAFNRIHADDKSS